MLIAIALIRELRLNISKPPPTVEEARTSWRSVSMDQIGLNGSVGHTAQSCGQCPNGPLWQLHRNMQWIFQ